MSGPDSRPRRAAMTRPDFGSFYREIIDARGMQGMMFGFIAAWWPLRHEKNVRFFHFADMKRDLAGSTRKVASSTRCPTHEDGMTDEIARHLYEVGSKIARDETALRRLYNGGDVS